MSFLKKRVNRAEVPSEARQGKREKIELIEDT